MKEVIKCNVTPSENEKREYITSGEPGCRLLISGMEWSEERCGVEIKRPTRQQCWQYWQDLLGKMLTEVALEDFGRWYLDYAIGGIKDVQRDQCPHGADLAFIDNGIKYYTCGICVPKKPEVKEAPPAVANYFEIRDRLDKLETALKELSKWMHESDSFKAHVIREALK